MGQRGKVKVESFAQRKQQTPQASDLDAVIQSEGPSDDPYVVLFNSDCRLHAMGDSNWL